MEEFDSAGINPSRNIKNILIFRHYNYTTISNKNIKLRTILYDFSKVFNKTSA